MTAPDSISSYLRLYGAELGDRVLSQFPALHQPSDPVWPALKSLKRRPFPAQQLAIMGIVKRWQEARCAAVVAECGTGKTLISLGSIFTHASGTPFTALAMVPPQLVFKWAREVFHTLPGVRVFLVDGCRNGVASNGFKGVNEVRLRNGRVVARRRRPQRSRRFGLQRIITRPRHAGARKSVVHLYSSSLGNVPSSDTFGATACARRNSGPFLGSVVNPDTGKPVLVGDDQLRRPDFGKVKHSEMVLPDSRSIAEEFLQPAVASR